MERAGIDIITDGEIRRESYSNRFATALAGVDLDNPATVQGRTSGTVVVPRIVGPIRRIRPVEVHDVEFLRANTDRKIKITLPGPFTMSRQAKNDFYKDEEELVMDYAAAVNAELRSEGARDRCDPARQALLQARAEGAHRLALPAIDRALDGIAGPTALHLCFGYALCRPRQAEPLRLPAGAHGLEGRADLDRSRPAKPRSYDPRRAR
jgi:5-methyltetrahydropteroyltriglutamate--homocysteine methyltransferase